jgi:hypothetical protein
MLRAKREDLLHQLDAVDKALAALTRAEITVASTPLVAPTRVAPRRVQTDEHRQASIEGRRKAHHSREAAAGRVREALEVSPKPAAATRLPRLVKRGEK